MSSAKTTETRSQTKRFQEIRVVLWSVLALNVLVAIAKLGYGLLSHSLSMQADGFHSLFDGLSNIIGLTGLWIASKPPDDNHPYGHKKFEVLAAAGIGGMLVATSLYILWRTFETVTQETQPYVSATSFGVMCLTMGINLIVTLWEQHMGKKLRSEVLLADSYHTASDLFTSLSVVVGLIAVRLGYSFVDPLIAIAIALVIGWTALTLFKEVIRSLTDAVRLDPAAIQSVAQAIPGVLDCHDVRTRGVLSHIFVDLSIHVQSRTSIESAHKLSHALENAIKEQFENVEDVIVHIEPEGHQ